MYHITTTPPPPPPPSLLFSIYTHVCLQFHSSNQFPQFSIQPLFIYHTSNGSLPKRNRRCRRCKKPDAGPVTVVLKLDLHCEGCAKKIKKSISTFEGVESVRADTAGNKLTVTGKVDPTRVKERVEFKTKKKVDILSPQPKKDGAEEKKKDTPPEKKADDKKDDEKKAENPKSRSRVRWF
ncbi:putative heavy metal-associated isoprenylated plant protein/5/6 [Helianthus annuus]|nr:putative heavy metal-associated isoprenylated plant protein/5/6 [Helianthus annuus]